MNNLTIEEFIQSCRDEWETNKKVKLSDIDDVLTKKPYNLYYNEDTMEWTPVEIWAFRGYVMNKLLSPHHSKKNKIK